MSMWKKMKVVWRGVSAFAGRNGRYAVVAIIFLIAVLYNVFVAPIKDTKSSLSVKLSDLEQPQDPDLEGNRPTKRYDDVFSSRPGDWYRLGMKAQALDTDETLRVSLLSILGKEKEIGKIEIKKKDGEKYFEFVFSTDDVYEDVVILKEGETEKDRWRGGKVMLPYFSLNRLGISNDREAKALRPTLLGETRTDNILVVSPEADENVTVPKQSFVKWGLFRATGRRMLSVGINARSEGDGALGKYRLQLHDYDAETKTVNPKIVGSVAFAESNLKNMPENEGVYRFDLYAPLEKDKMYAVALAKEKDSRGTIMLNEITDEDGSSGSFVVAVIPSSERNAEDRLLTGAKVEDMGSVALYTYAARRAITDFADVDDASGNVSFDDKSGLVKGDAKMGTEFTYRIDTVYPFQTLRVQAKQSGTRENQIRLEYSLDKKAWKDVASVQDKGESRIFDDVIVGEKQAAPSLIYFKVSYAGEKDRKESFALESFRVTAMLERMDAKTVR